MLNIFYQICVIGGVMFITSYLSYACLQISAEKLTFQLRARYLASLMRQEVAFFEKQQVEALPSKMAEYFSLISEGIGEKYGQLLNSVGATITGIVLGIVVNPFYAAILLIYMPIGIIFMRKFSALAISKVIVKMGFSAKLGGFTEEMLSALKLIISFGKE